MIFAFRPVTERVYTGAWKIPALFFLQSAPHPVDPCTRIIRVKLRPVTRSTPDEQIPDVAIHIPDMVHHNKV